MKKLLVLLLLSMTVGLVGCKDKVEENSEHAVLLTPTEQTSQSTETTQQTQNTTQQKPKPAGITDEVALDTKDKVIFIGDEEPEQKQEVVEQVEEVEEEPVQELHVEDIIATMKSSTPTNYRAEMNVEGKAQGSSFSMKYYVDTTEYTRHDIMNMSMQGMTITEADTWYDFKNGKVYTTALGMTNEELIDQAYKLIPAILNASKDHKFVDSNIDGCYAISCKLDKHTMGHGTTANEVGAILYVDKTTNLLHKIQYVIDDTYLKANSVDAYACYILFGKYNEVNISLPQSIGIQDVNETLSASTLYDNGINACTSGYNMQVQIDGDYYTEVITPTDMYKTSTINTNGLSFDKKEYYSAKNGKTYVIESENGINGYKENIYTYDGPFEYVSMRKIVSQITIYDKTEPILGYLSLKGNIKGLAFTDKLALHSGDCVLHLDANNYRPMFIELDNGSDALNDGDLYSSRMSILFTAHDNTQLSVPAEFITLFKSDFMGG